VRLWSLCKLVVCDHALLDFQNGGAKDEIGSIN
jgi:hypothetical protein